jgi:hypothetical protein
MSIRLKEPACFLSRTPVICAAVPCSETRRFRPSARDTCHIRETFIRGMMIGYWSLCDRHGHTYVLERFSEFRFVIVYR